MMMPSTTRDETETGNGTSSVDDDPVTNDLTLDPAALPGAAEDHDLGRPTSTRTIDPSALPSTAENDDRGRPVSPAAVTDIASVQDIEAATKDGAGTESTPPRKERTASPAVDVRPSSVRRAKRLYRCLPMIIEYRSAMLACFLLLVTLLVVLTDDSLDDSTEMEHPLYVYNPSSANDQHHPPRRAEPQWFRTTEAQYQHVFAHHDAMLAGLTVGAGDAGVAFRSSHALAGVFCGAQGLGLCGYDDYCPRGRGQRNAGGRHAHAHAWNALESLAAVQWAPFGAPTGDAVQQWVQVGTVPASEAGGADNDYGRCWTWDDWTGGRGERNIEAEWGEDHRRWILCCDTDRET